MNDRKIIEKMIDTRKKRNMSQRMLAYACKIPQSTLARIESGATVPKLDTLIKLADQLKLELKLSDVDSDD